MKLKTQFLGLLFICLLSTTTSNAQEAMLGEVKIFAGTFAPRGWAICKGQTLTISENSALFSIIGTIYGGDGRATFRLPDLCGRVAMGSGTGLGLSSYSLGRTSGVESNNLTLSQLPSHKHNVIINNNGTVSIPVNTEGGNEDEANPGAGVLTNTGNDIFSSEATAGAKYTGAPILVQGITASTSNTGANQAIENRQPSLSINYIICTQGYYPSRQ